MSTSSIPILPKGLHHLESIHASKFRTKFPSRLPHPPRQFVQPEDRIRTWNIRPKDKVRILVGKASDKYLDEGKGSKGGWKVYTVKSVDMERSKVYLEGFSNKKSATSRPKPLNFDNLSDEEKRDWEQKSTIAPMNRPIHYSNVQLLVEEAGPESVFATRLSTSPPYFNKGKRRLEWNRYATSLSGPSNLELDPEVGKIKINWPEAAAEKMPEATQLDTKDPSSSTLRLASSNTPQLSDQIALLSSPIRSSVETITSSRKITNQYLSGNSESSSSSDLDTLMPLMLSEELSPRFSRAKKTKNWNDRRQQSILAKASYVSTKLKEWEAQGRDSSLILQPAVLSEAGLDGVKIRGRTRKEIREAAETEWDALEEERIKEYTKRINRGEKMLYDLQGNELGWELGEKGLKLRRGRHRKALKVEKIVRRLENLKLEDGKNMVIPQEVRAS